MSTVLSGDETAPAYLGFSSRGGSGGVRTNQVFQGLITYEDSLLKWSGFPFQNYIVGAFKPPYNITITFADGRTRKQVYELNHGSTVRAGLVQGPCEVFPPNKFKEENQNNGLRPNFLFKLAKENSALKATYFGLSDFIKPDRFKLSGVIFSNNINPAPAAFTFG
ncbi:hypothetical protein IFM89_022166 [Coptis chinensis]|uniref:Uncharacterized protein n=1 Tax=Coptis chinensis TaxID=261450 RepID=A0A835MFN0_9MAGN|nr:hypothetical protein IFM89_022166 [Coptis chinensis]